MPHIGRDYPFIFRRDLAFPLSSNMAFRAPPMYCITLPGSWSWTEWSGLVTSYMYSELAEIDNDTGSILWRFLGSRVGHPEIELRLGIDLTHDNPECVWQSQVVLDGDESPKSEYFPERRDYGGDSVGGPTLISKPGFGTLRAFTTRYAPARWEDLDSWPWPIPPIP